MRKLSNSTPTVINTELRPFDESFRIDANGQLEQWFYDNTSQYVPDRTVAVLTLTPVLSVYDADTDKSYTTASTQGEEDYIAFYYLQWYVNEYNGTTYQETLITSSSDGAGVNYFTQGNNLIVKKNVSYAHAVTIRCVATYIDPRDAGITYSVEDSVILSCSRDATVVLPEVAIVSPSARSFNPLVDGYTTENGVEVQNTEYEFEGTVTNSPAVEHVTSSDLAEYKVDGWGTEEIESASGSCSPTLTIRYPDGSIDTDARFMYRKTADGTKLDVSGNAFITNIKGNTVPWNQIAKAHNELSFSSDTETWFRVTNLGYKPLVNQKIYLSAEIKKTTDFVASETTSGQRLVIQKQPGSFHGGEIRTLSVPKDNVYHRISGVVSNANANNDSIALQALNHTAGNMYVKNVMAINLTTIYGVGNEPTSPAVFEADYLKWFGKPLTYETYDAGSLKPVKMLSMKTVGFNFFDVNSHSPSNDSFDFTGTSGYRTKRIKLLPNTTYRVAVQASAYSDYVILIHNNARVNETGYFDTRFAGNRSQDLTTGADGYLYIGRNGGTNATSTARLREIKLTITLDTENSRNWLYQPYWSNKSMLNVTEIKGRVVTNGEPTGNLVTIFPDGMKRVGGVYDEIKLGSDGKIHAIKRIETVADLGARSYSQNSTSIYSSYLNPIPSYGIGKTMTSKFGYSNSTSLNDRYTYCQYIYAPNSIHVVDNANNSSPATMKASLQGVTMYYQLATAVDYIIDEIQSPFIFKWFGINSSGQEVDATTMPWYKEGQDTSKLKVDAMYGENINVVLRCTKGAGLNELSPSKAFASLSWRIPEIDCHVISYNGGAVRVGDDNDELTMRFGTTINVRGQVLSEARRNAHLRLNWKYRHSNSPEENDVGWDNEIEIPNNNLIHVRGTGGGTLASTLVYPYVYLLGPWKPATSTTTPYTKPTTTKDGASYERTID